MGHKKHFAQTTNGVISYGWKAFFKEVIIEEVTIIVYEKYFKTI